jgi:hypothetical protein
MQIDVYLPGRGRVTFLPHPGERAERIILEVPDSWDWEVDYLLDRVITPTGNQVRPDAVLAIGRTLLVESRLRRRRYDPQVIVETAGT